MSNSTLQRTGIREGEFRPGSESESDSWKDCEAEDVSGVSGSECEKDEDEGGADLVCERTSDVDECVDGEGVNAIACG